MSVKSAYVKENYGYSIWDIIKLFSFNGISDNNLKAFISILNNSKILDVRSKTIEEDKEILKESFRSKNLISEDKIYIFKFVGIFILASKVIYAYPKYLGNNKNLFDYKPEKEMYQVMQVINKYNREKSSVNYIDFFSGLDGESNLSNLEMMMFLIDDYANNGPYTSDEEIINRNDNNEILWQKTIDETHPIIQDNRPIYIDYYTRSNVLYEEDYFRRLHKAVVKNCFEQLSNVGLDSYFNLPQISLEEDIEDFGDFDYISERIDRETSQIFDDRSLFVLKLLYSYFKEKPNLLGEQSLEIYGTKSFHSIWEEVCSKVLSSQKEDYIKDIEPKLNISSVNKDFRNKEPRLVDLIEQPIWKKHKKGAIGIPKNTFNPDGLIIHKDKKNKGYSFSIIDAKYYCPNWSDVMVEDIPGIEDISKQYLYQLAYQDLLEKNNITTVRNYFLMPKRGGYNKREGFVKLNIFKNIGLQNIDIIMLDPEFMYENYLKNIDVDISLIL